MGYTGICSGLLFLEELMLLLTVKQVTDSNQKVRTMFPSVENSTTSYISNFLVNTHEERYDTYGC
ncbi:hypothetical protein AMTRI_Chr04g188920 [Amborella trichopoda]